MSKNIKDTNGKDKIKRKKSFISSITGSSTSLAGIVLILLLIFINDLLWRNPFNDVVINISGNDTGRKGP